MKKRSRKELKLYRTKKKYMKDRKRMLSKGYDISREKMVIGELEIEYVKDKRKVDKHLPKEIIIEEITSLMNTKKINMMTQGVTGYDVGYITALEKALEIINTCIGE